LKLRWTASPSGAPGLGRFSRHPGSSAPQPAFWGTRGVTGLLTHGVTHVWTPNTEADNDRQECLSHKAEGTALGRFVALKFLPGETAHDRGAIELWARVPVRLRHPRQHTRVRAGTRPRVRAERGGCFALPDKAEQEAGSGWDDEPSAIFSELCARGVNMLPWHR
jgi:hypothetical protein